MPCRRSCLVLLLAPFLAACSMVFPAHIDSQFTSDESVKIVFYPKPAGVPELEFAPLAVLAPVLIGFAVDAISKGLEEEAKRFEASYSVRGSDRFYQVSGGVPRPRFGHFVVTRTGAKKIRSPVAALYPMLRGRAGLPEETSKFVFLLAPSDTGDTFKLVLTEAYLRRSKAKVLYPNWNEYWWTRIPLVYGFLYDVTNLLGILDWGDGAIDVDISVALEAVWVDKKGERASLGTFNQKLRNVKLDGNCTIPPFPAPTAPSSVYCRNLVPNGASTGWLPGPPLSKSGSKLWDGGLGEFTAGSFDVTVKVSEFDDFKETVLKGAELVKKQKDNITSGVTGALGSE